MVRTRASAKLCAEASPKKAASPKKRKASPKKSASPKKASAAPLISLHECKRAAILSSIPPSKSGTVRTRLTKEEAAAAHLRRMRGEDIIEKGASEYNLFWRKHYKKGPKGLDEEARREYFSKESSRIAKLWEADKKARGVVCKPKKSSPKKRSPKKACK